LEGGSGEKVYLKNVMVTPNTALKMIQLAEAEA
jgi:hypothetical protein